MYEDSEVITREMVDQFSGDNQMRGQLSTLRGKKNEERFIKAWSPEVIQGLPYTKWLREVIPATKVQDSHGIDAVIHTGISQLEEIGIQVKSSFKAAISFRLRHPEIPVVVIEDCYNQSDIRRSTIIELVEMLPNFYEYLRLHGTFIELVEMLPNFYEYLRLHGTLPKSLRYK
jgi:hypothetical protein